MKLAVHTSPQVTHQGLQSNGVGVRMDTLNVNDFMSFEGHRAGKYRYTEVGDVVISESSSVLSLLYQKCQQFSKLWLEHTKDFFQIASCIDC